MWFKKTPPPPPDHQLLWDLVESQARIIYQLETALARATNQPLPGPWHPPSRPPLLTSTPSNQTKKPLGAEAVSIMNREARMEAEAKAAVQTAFKPPAYLGNPSPIPPSQIPEGKRIGGGFSSPQSEPSPDRNPPPESPSTGS